LKNKNDIKITAGKTNENENYYKRKNENEKSGANHTAILCKPAVAQQCEHYLASSSWTENSGIIWWLSSWISTSLKSGTHLLIWLRQMPPHSRNRSRLFTAGWLLLRRILYAHQHHRLTWSVFFLCVAFCVVADAVACSCHLKCARV